MTNGDSGVGVVIVIVVVVVVVVMMIILLRRPTISAFMPRLQEFSIIQ